MGQRSRENSSENLRRSLRSGTVNSKDGSVHQEDEAEKEKKEKTKKRVSFQLQ